MNIKKIIVTVTFALSSLMSVGVALAQTSYDFTASFVEQSVSPYPNIITYRGQANTDNLGNITALNNVAFYQGTSLPISWNSITPGSFGGTINAPGSLNLQSEPQFVSGSYNFYFTDVSNGGGYIGTNYVNVVSFLGGTTLTSPILLPGYADKTLTGNVNVAIAGAPEMNASFIPQVALMLACLFFLMGRKKETVEPMLAV